MRDDPSLGAMKNRRWWVHMKEKAFL